MKKLLTLIFIVYSSSFIVLKAQTPEKINRINLQPHEQDYYNKQSALWKGEVSKRPKDAQAWENYYLATRYCNQMYLHNQGADKEKAMKDIVSGMEKNVPNTIEYYRCRLSIEGNSNKDTAAMLKMIRKALEINPNDGDVLEEYINYCEINDKTEKLADLTRRLYNSKTYAFGIMEIDYNMLMSADKDAILFTDGDNDTYPAWMLQQVKGIRPDVTVINVALAARFPQMMKRLLKEKGIVLPDEFLKKGESTTDEMQFLKELVLMINKQFPQVPIYFATTCDVESTFPDSLYCTGLAWRFSTIKIDNLPMLKNNVENHFHIDYLNGGVVDEGISEDLVEECNSLYVTPFALLYKHYKAKGVNSDKIEFYKSFVMKYAKKMGKEKEMHDYLETK
jgi:hypothetical protein